MTFQGFVHKMVFDTLTRKYICKGLKTDMAQDKKQVEQITDMEVDFAQWYTDVCRKAELIDYSSIKGMFIYRPYGYAIWEATKKKY